MAVFIWFMVRDTMLILSGMIFALNGNPGWAALMFLFFLIILIQSFRKPEETKK